MRYIIDYCICAFVIAVVTMSFFFLSPRLHNQQERIYALIGCDIILICVLDVNASFLEGVVADGILMALLMSYQLLLHVLPCAMVYYLLVLTGSLPGLRRWIKIMIAVPYSIDVAFLVTAPMNHLIFQVTDRRYQHGPMVFILYLNALVYMLASLFILLRASKRVAGRRLFAALSFIFMQLVAAGFQFFNPQYLLIDMAAALSLLIMYIALHSATEITDSLTGAYNEAALQTLIHELLARKKPFFLLGCKVEGLHDVNATYTSAAGDALLMTVARELDLCLHGRTARIFGDRFCVLLGNCEDLQTINRKLDSLPERFMYNGYEIGITLSLRVLDSRDFEDDGNILHVLEFSYNQLPGADGRPRWWTAPYGAPTDVGSRSAPPWPGPSGTRRWRWFTSPSWRRVPAAAAPPKRWPD